MKCLCLIPMLLNKEKEVDYELMEIMLNKNIDIDGYILFSPFMEGNTFSINEKELIYTNLKKICNKALIYEVSSTLLKDEMDALKRIKPDAIMLTLLHEKKLSSKGHELYVINRMKDLNIPFYIHHEENMDSSFLCYQNIMRIKRILPTFLGIFEENNDYNLLRKLSSLTDFETYSNLKNNLNKPVDLKIKGIVSDLFLIFYKEIQEYYLELENHFINSIMKEYLLFVESIIEEYPRAMAIKYLLYRGSENKLYSRLPYYRINAEEKSKLDYLF